MTTTRRCPRCKLKKPAAEFYTNGYCKGCMSEYSRIRKENAALARQGLPPTEKPRPPAKPVRKAKSITIKVKGKPAATKALRKPYSELIKPPVLSSDRAETVEEFLARGGQISQVPLGATGIKE